MPEVYLIINILDLATPMIELAHPKDYATSPWQQSLSPIHLQLSHCICPCTVEKLDMQEQLLQNFSLLARLGFLAFKGGM